MEPKPRIELGTSSLPRKRSTPELHGRGVKEFIMAIQLKVNSQHEKGLKMP